MIERPTQDDAATAVSVGPARALLASICVCALIAAAAWIVFPFAKAAVWAGMIVVVTWPLLLRMQARLWHRRGLAVAAMLLLLLVLVVAPLTFFIGTLVSNADELVRQARTLSSAPSFELPLWLAQTPFIGGRLSIAWHDIVAAGFDGLWTRFVPYAGSTTAWILGRAGSLGYLALQFVLILLLSAFMFAHGEKIAAAMLRFGKRLGGEQGTQIVKLATQAIRGVALGVGLTAAVQSILGGAGLAVAGVPFAGLLTALLFVLCIAQIGMLILLIPAVVWVFWNGHPGLGALLLVWSLAASLLDNVLRPVLVRRTADLPLLLIFLGVIGGLVAFGPLGIFVGPVVLAVAYTLLLTWVRSDEGVAVPPQEDAPQSVREAVKTQPTGS